MHVVIKHTSASAANYMASESSHLGELKTSLANYLTKIQQSDCKQQI